MKCEKGIIEMRKKKSLFTLIAATGVVFSITAKLTSCSWAEGSEIRLITDSGLITDRSFNESGYVAICDLANKNSLNEKHYFRPKNPNGSTIAAGYRAAEATGAKYIMAPGFYHIGAISQYLSEVKDSKLHWILIDGNGSLETKEMLPIIKNRVASVKFDMMSTAFIGGFKTAYNTQYYAKPKVATFGGGNFPGVTDYMVGWLAGVNAANKYNENVAKNSAWKHVSIAKFKSDTAYTESGFVNVKMAKDKSTLLINEGANAILPVAGSEVAGTISAINEQTVSADKKPFVIGVDTDMSKTYPQFKSLFFDSVLKNITYAMEAIYVKNVLATSKIDVNTVNNFKEQKKRDSIEGFYKRFGQDENFSTKGTIDLSDSGINNFGSVTAGNAANHFAGVTTSNTWKPGTKKLFDTAAQKYLATVNNYLNPASGSTLTQWEKDWLTSHSDLKNPGLTWDNFLATTVANWKV